MVQTNEEMVKKLLKEKIIKKEETEKAFLEIDRSNFIPENKKEYSYIDKPIPIGKSQTISAPHMVAIMIENLEIENNSKIMEIGTGSGYQAAIMAKIAEKGGVHSIEINKKLFRMLKEKLNQYKNIKIYKGDGSKGIPEKAPFDRIVSTCGIPRVPKTWKNQLKEKGIIIAPLGSKFHQRLMKYRKINGEIKEKDLNLPCAFVPMIGEHGF